MPAGFGCLTGWGSSCFWLLLVVAFRRACRGRPAFVPPGTAGSTVRQGSVSGQVYGISAGQAGVVGHGDDGGGDAGGGVLRGGARERMTGTWTCGRGAGPGRRRSGISRSRWSRPGSRCSRGGSRDRTARRARVRTGHGAGPGARPSCPPSRARPRGRRTGDAPGHPGPRRPRPRVPAGRDPGNRSGHRPRAGPAPRRSAPASRSAVSDPSHRHLYSEASSGPGWSS